MIIKNDASYWLCRTQFCKFNIPYTEIRQINDEWFNWLKSDNYTKEKVAEFGKYLRSLIKGTKLENADKLFIKTGVFSGKFDFNNRCRVLKDGNLGEQFLNIFYEALMVSAETSREIVFRQFIETELDRPSIYNGMKLNTEFRAFIDFDRNRLLGVFNYWDTATMLSTLRGEELKIYKTVYKNIETDFNKLMPKLINHIKNDCNIEKSELEGTWSVDFLWDGKKFWMIDMALAKQSYYYDKVMEADLNKDKDDQPIIYTREEIEYYAKLKQEHEKIIKEMFSKHF